MTQKQLFSVVAPALAAVMIAGACKSGDDDTDSNMNPSTTGSMSSTGVMSTTTPTGSMSTTTPTGSMSTTTPTGSMPSTSTSTSTTTEPAPMSTCTSVDYMTQNNDNSVSAFPGVQNVYFFGDTMTTACGTPTAGQLCVEGNALSSKTAANEYEYWGAGIGLQMATEEQAYDLAAQGVTQVRFSLSMVTGRPVRVQISQVDDPAITDMASNYQSNAFGWGGSSPTNTTADKIVTIGLDLFKLPSWTKIMADGAVATGQVLDATKIHSLQIQVANNPPDMPKKYSFCISSLEWLDMAGTPVAVTKLMAAPAMSGSAMPMMSSSAAPTGSEGGMGAAGNVEAEAGAPSASGAGGSTDSGAPPAPTNSAPAAGGAGGAGGAG